MEGIQIGKKEVKLYLQDHVIISIENPKEHTKKL